MSTFRDLPWRHSVALDVGTATTRIVTGTGSLIEIPSRLGACPGLAGGVVIDGATVSRLLTPMLHQSRIFGVVKPTVLACAPTDARPEERQLLTDSILRGGAASVSMIPEPLAAAIGAGVDVASPYAQMVIDLGEGVTDCAVIQSGKIRETCALRRGCAHFRNAIVQEAVSWERCDHSDAELLMRKYGINGPDAGAWGLVAAKSIEAALEGIAEKLAAFFRELPHGAACDIIDGGICLTGGGALIPGVREYLARRLRIGVRVPGNPLLSVAEGIRSILPVILSLNLLSRQENQ
ncbi:rod shape-determining protein [Geomesophilobacter sediminis]|uniref:Rod shape-determining protein n=1 Tax=Geomesophilobacter sediminis TaxID=2798584 RepID=A0A8J7IY64_9BACT|nr:rod shape-determining protein [Geomesophilobacter sediminis]MBJ6725042.1 rod shape-determining protein [Geomesophilobacter sediminis]